MDYQDFLGNIYFGYNAVSSNKEVVIKLFHYFASNTNVEWSLYSFDTDKGDEFILGTFHEEGLSPGWPSEYDESNLNFAIHVHPDKHGTKGGSNIDNDDGKVYGDMALITQMSRRFEERGQKLPTNYVYHKESQNVYRFTPTNPSIYIRHITSYKNLMFLR